MSRYPEPGANKMFSGNQIAILTFFFGPLAGVAMLKKNFDVMGERSHAKNTLIYGLVASAVLFLLSPFLPESIPAAVYAISYTVAAQTYFNTYQKTAFQNAERESTWKALGISALCIIVTAIILILIIMAYGVMGWIQIEQPE